MKFEEFFYAVDDLAKYPGASKMLRDIIRNGVEGMNDHDLQNHYMLRDEPPKALADMILLCAALKQRHFQKSISRAISLIHDGAAGRLAWHQREVLDRLANEAEG